MANGILQTEAVWRRFGFISFTSDYPLAHRSLKLAYES
jgi:hypothetical protein